MRCKTRYLSSECGVCKIFRFLSIGHCSALFRFNSKLFSDILVGFSFNKRVCECLLPANHHHSQDGSSDMPHMHGAIAQLVYCLPADYRSIKVDKRSRQCAPDQHKGNVSALFCRWVYLCLAVLRISIKVTLAHFSAGGSICAYSIPTRHLSSSGDSHSLNADWIRA